MPPEMRIRTITGDRRIKATTSDKASFGYALWKYRTDRNITLREAEAKIGCCAANLSKIERGGQPTMTLKTFISACRWMGISLDNGAKMLWKGEL